MSMSPSTCHDYDGGWFVATLTFKPTEMDTTGCDGVYVKAIHIKWWGRPIALFIALKGWLFP